MGRERACAAEGPWSWASGVRKGQGWVVLTEEAVIISVANVKMDEF